MRRPREEPTKLGEFGDLLTPDQAMEPILAKPVRSALLEWLTEIFAKEELQAMKVGALDYILKPFKLSVILPVLSRALTVRRLRVQARQR